MAKRKARRPRQGAVDGIEIDASFPQGAQEIKILRAAREWHRLDNDAKALAPTGGKPFMSAVLSVMDAEDALHRACEG